MKKTVLKVIKIGQEHYMDNLLLKGELYFNTISSFIRQDRNQERYDDHEGAENIKQVKWLKIQSVDGAGIELSKANSKLTKLSSAYLLTHPSSINGSVYCCSAVTPDTVNRFIKLDPRFKNFGDTLILIENPKIFFDRIESELNHKKYEFEIGFVHYYDPKVEERPLSIFSKKMSLCYQNEIRILIKNNAPRPIKVHIGQIKDIAVKYKIDDILNATSPSSQA
jgi:hypothetical protein